MAKIRRVDFSPDEWLQGTRRLDNATRGLYITACALIYSIGGPIDEEDLKSVCRDHGNAFNRQLQKLLDLDKLQKCDGKIMNKRCGIELENAQKRSEKASESARNRWENNDSYHANAMLTINHQPSENIYTPIIPTANAVGMNGNSSRQSTRQPLNRANGTNPRALHKNPRALAADKWGHLAMTREQQRLRFNATSADPDQSEHDHLRQLLHPGLPKPGF